MSPILKKQQPNKIPLFQCLFWDENGREVKDAEEETWGRETVPKFMRIVSSKLSQKDLSFLLLVIDLRAMNNAGNRLVAALSMPRYRHVKEIDFEFAQDIEDKHLELLKNKCSDSLQNLESLKLNGCQKISDKRIEIITSACLKLKIFSIYWNVRVTDVGIQHLVKNCKHVINLNLSGCKNIADKSLQLIADNYEELESLNLTSFVDEAYKKIFLLALLQFLDLCGAQNLSDEGLASIAECQNLGSLNLTWCVCITDVSPTWG